LKANNLLVIMDKIGVSVDFTFAIYDEVLIIYNMT